MARNIASGGPVEELIPESHRGSNHDLATLAALLGFVVMMILDVAFG